MSGFLSMGGYGAYVWSAFGFAAAVLVGLLIQSWRGARRREQELADLRQLMRPRAGAAAGRPSQARPAAGPSPVVMTGSSAPASE